MFKVLLIIKHVLILQILGLIFYLVSGLIIFRVKGLVDLVGFKGHHWGFKG